MSSVNTETGGEQKVLAEYPLFEAAASALSSVKRLRYCRNMARGQYVGLCRRGRSTQHWEAHCVRPCWNVFSMHKWMLFPRIF
jgi:hypothetical protein